MEDANRRRRPADGLSEPCSTVLSVEDGAVIVAFRRHTPLPLDDDVIAEVHTAEGKLVLSVVIGNSHVTSTTSSRPTTTAGASGGCGA